MPIYEFRDKETGEIKPVLLKISELDDYKVNNSHLEQYFSDAPSLIGGRDMSGGRLPEGFKDKLRDIKQKHPGAGGVDHLI